MAFFDSGPGLAYLHRLVMALHVVFVEIGACGIRLVCLFLDMMGLNRFVGTSYGRQGHREGGPASCLYRWTITVGTERAQPIPCTVPP